MASNQRMHKRVPVVFAIALALAGCAQPLQKPEPGEAAPVSETTPLRFVIEAGMNDTWNAVGQILVRTPGVTYDGRAQMMGLNAVHYRGESLLLLTRALPVSDTIKVPTTEVTVAAPDGKLMRSDGAAELMAVIERELPAELEHVRAGLAAQDKAAHGPKARKKKKSKK